MMRDWDEYQELVTKVKKYPEGQEELYLLGKLTEECGEVAKEIVRKSEGRGNSKDFTSELGDLLWVITALAKENNIKLSDIVRNNLNKLQERNLL